MYELVSLAINTWGAIVNWFANKSILGVSLLWFIIAVFFLRVMVRNLIFKS